MMGRWQPPINGGAHSFCQAASQSSGDAWLEGYATAFGPRVQEKVPIFDWRTSPEGTLRGTPIEHFRCTRQMDMLTSEGRVAAGIWDMMDFAVGQDESECMGKVSAHTERYCKKRT